MQTECGDIFKVTLHGADSTSVSEIKIKYFDTVPAAASLCLLKSGFLFVANEFGNQCVAPAPSSVHARISRSFPPCSHLYQIQGIGDNTDEPEHSSADAAEV